MNLYQRFWNIFKVQTFQDIYSYTHACNMFSAKTNRNNKLYSYTAYSHWNVGKLEVAFEALLHLATMKGLYSGRPMEVIHRFTNYLVSCNFITYSGDVFLPTYNWYQGVFKNPFAKYQQLDDVHPRSQMFGMSSNTYLSNGFPSVSRIVMLWNLPRPMNSLPGLVEKQRLLRQFQFDAVRNVCGTT